MSAPDSRAAAAAPLRTASSSPVSALRNAQYRTLWLAQLVANFGTMVQVVGASWLMTLLSPSPDWVAAVQSAMSLPLVVFSVIGGAVADLWDRRIAMMVAQSWMLFVATLLAVVTGLGAATPVLLLVLTFALGAGQAFSSPAWNASIGQLVPRADLPSAIALGGIGFNLARTLGPALGGLIVGLAGPEGAFLFNAVSFTGVILGLTLWRRASPAPGLPRERLFYAILTGVRYVSAAPDIRAIVVRSAGFAFFASSVLALLPLVAKDSLQGGPFTFGVLFGSFGAGGIIGGALSVRLRNQAGIEPLLLTGTVAFALATMLIAWAPATPVVMLALVVSGVSWMMVNSSCNFTVQMLAPNWVKARSLSIYQTFMFAGTALGAWVWGHVATAYGVPWALVAAGICGLITPALALRFPAAAVEGVDLTPAGLGPLPEPALDVDPASGPILISVTYDIPPERTAAFLQSMRDIRRIRRRDGAVGWGLHQDLNAPRRWVESYELATWTDLLRLRERRMYADAEAFARARACHAGAGPPTISRMLMQAPAHRIRRAH